MRLVEGNIQIRQVSWAEFGNEIGTLRAAVWLPLGGVRAEHLTDGMLIDDWEDNSQHWAAFEEGLLVASARLTISSQPELFPLSPALDAVKYEVVAWPVASMMRLVVKETHRGLGLAKALDRTRLEMAKAEGCKEAFLITGTRPGMLQEIGFHSVGTIECDSVIFAPPRKRNRRTSQEPPNYSASVYEAFTPFWRESNELSLYRLELGGY